VMVHIQASDAAAAAVGGISILSVFHSKESKGGGRCA
jgi:hypothetical protein